MKTIQAFALSAACAGILSMSIAAEIKTEAIPQDYAAQETVALKLEDLSRDGSGERYLLKLRLINPTKLPVIIHHTPVKSIRTRTQIWKDGKWEDWQDLDPEVLKLHGLVAHGGRIVSRCGTGSGSITIEPGQSLMVSASVPADKLPARIGLAYRDPSKLAGSPLLTAWSEKIER